MAEQRYVVGPDGHVLSETEQQEATRLDEPVSTGNDAPDTRAELVNRVALERAQKMIRTYQRRIERDEAELAATDDTWLKSYLEGNIPLHQRRIAELEEEIRALTAQGMSR